MNPWDDFTVDHMDPRIQGGGNELPNLIPCCKRCNSRKGGKTVEAFRSYLQEKGSPQFWGEISLKVIPEEVESSNDGYPDFETYTQIIDACFRVGRNARSNVALTMIALNTFAFDWGKGTDGYHSCAGFFDIESLCWKTCQPADHVLSDIFYLIEKQLLVITWKGGQDGSHFFDFATQQVIALGKSIRKSEWQGLTVEI